MSGFPFHLHCIPMLPLLPGPSIARSGTGRGRQATRSPRFAQAFRGSMFCRPVTLSKRTLARSGEAAPGLWHPKGVLVPWGRIECKRAPAGTDLNVDNNLRAIAEK